MIEASGLSVAIGVKPIVSEVSLKARAGEVTVIIGPNGSGKTTLMRALSGEIPYAGSIRMNGNEIAGTKLGQLSAMRAVLPQATSLAFPFTVREIVRLGILDGRPGGAAQSERLPELALERVDLAGYAGRFYQELSGGEQQRVQLARVLCQVWQPVEEGVPRYLLLDEPVSSLDIRHQLVIMEIAQDFARNGGGVVAILHDLNLTAMFADHVIVMSGGRLAASGARAEVLKDDILARVFQCALKVNALPGGMVPFVLPQTACSGAP
ncbi:heme ABC transporter ATP-binding protein [Chelativorans sp. Marseille-P2723]|uniref:heme ABC transporter ATP-binding protein n=1 Tax=Chelativorans sp. Marseille-P2723 TaxID=2709133 RepID=UPI00157123ED|nr:heme ABC transporter ATP-binding protein [Chelativorans sp. Marseille-P2723]